MSLDPIRMKVIGGLGGPEHDSIPVYTEIDKAPLGGQQIGLDGKQLMLKNNKELITFDPKTIDVQLDTNLKSFFQLKDGKPIYQRVWLIEEGAGEDANDVGVDWNKLPLIVETSHLEKLGVVDPGNPPPPEPEGVQKFKIISEYTNEQGERFLELLEV